jgi:cyclopropane fatty-acyl-phospholipid synthase-like methyltransferase
MTKEKIDHFYEGIGSFIGSLKTDNWHVGYWPDHYRHAPFEEAQVYMTDQIISRLAETEGQNVLDVGCGIGGPAIHLARKGNCTVTGITNSHSQVERASALAEQSGLGDRVAFQYADGAALPFEDGTFDSAMAIESLGQMPDCYKAFGEISRVLKPGGTLVFSDNYAITPMSDEQKAMLYTYYLISSVYTRDEFSELLDEAGFAVKEMTDITRHIQRTVRELLVLIVRSKAELREKYGDEALDNLKKDWQKMAYSYANFGYIVGVCVKRK